MMLKGLFITVFIFNLFMVNLFAAPQVFETFEEKPLENTIKSKQVENVSSPGGTGRQRVVYEREGLRDPFQKPVPVVKESEKTVVKPEAPVMRETPPPSLTVQGLIWGGKFPQAIINDKVVTVGDTIQNASIVSIDKDGVGVLFEGRSYKLSVSLSGAADTGLQKISSEVHGYPAKK